MALRENVYLEQRGDLPTHTHTHTHNTQNSRETELADFYTCFEINIFIILTFFSASQT